MTALAPAHRLGLALLAVFALALALRLRVAAQYQAGHPQAEMLVIDEAAYDAWGARIAAGAGSPPEVFFQEPSYPYFLGSIYWLAGHERWAVRVVQCALGALTAVLVGVLGARVFGRAAGVLAALVFAVHRPALLFPALLLKPSLFLALLAALAWALVRTRGAGALRWLAVGLLGGLGALLRGNVLVLLPALVLWPFLHGRRAAYALPRCALALAGILVVLAPVAARNLRVGGVLAVTSGAGTNVYGGNSLDNPHGRATELDFVRGIPEHEADDWRREAERRAGRPLDAGEVSRFWLGETWRSFRERPLAHLSILWNKLRLTLGAYELPDNHHLEWDARYVPALRAVPGGFGLWGVLGIAGVLVVLTERERRERRPETLDLALLFALYAATIVATVTSMRIRLALVPLLAPFAGALLARAWRALRERGSAREAGRIAAALGVAIACVHIPVLDARERELDLDKRDFNLAAQWIDAGRLEEGGALALELDRKHPGTARVRALLALADYERAERAARAGDAAAAERHLREALRRIEPFQSPRLESARERFRVEHLAGRVYFALGEWEPARRAFGAAAEFDPQSFALRRHELLAGLRAAEGGPPGSRRAELARVDQLARELERATWLGAEERPWLALDRAEIDFARARALVAEPADEGPEGERAAQSARELREDALARLRALVQGPALAPELVVSARLAAARIQVYLRRPRAARNHLEAVLEIDAGHAEARRLLDELEEGGG